MSKLSESSTSPAPPGGRCFVGAVSLPGAGHGTGEALLRDDAAAGSSGDGWRLDGNVVQAAPNGAIACVGGLRIRDDRLQRRCTEAGLATALLEAFAADGVDVLGRLGGDYSLALLLAAPGPSSSVKLLLANDRMGIGDL